MDARIANHAVSRTTNATAARKNLFQLIATANQDSVPVHITSPRGNAVLLSEEEYNGLVETLYLQSIPGMTERKPQAGTMDRTAPNLSFKNATLNDDELSQTDMLMNLK